jgi:hypothetical protein
MGQTDTDTHTNRIENRKSNEHTERGRDSEGGRERSLWREKSICIVVWSVPLGIGLVI